MAEFNPRFDGRPLPDDPAAAVAELGRRYPRWMITGSPLGRYWATTREHILQPGHRATLDADTPSDLDRLLFDQERLRAKATER